MEQFIPTEIIEGCRMNKSRYQEKLYKKLYGYALAIALRYCYSSEDAAEVVNDSFIKVFKNINKFDSTGPFKPWFRRIVINTSIDKIRAHKKFQNHLEVENVPLVSHVDVVSELTAEQVIDLFDELPALQRIIINMYEMEGYSHDEIAEKLNIPAGSSRAYLSRAKSKLRILYKKYF